MWPQFLSSSNIQIAKDEERRKKFLYFFLVKFTSSSCCLYSVSSLSRTIFSGDFGVSSIIIFDLFGFLNKYKELFRPFRRRLRNPGIFFFFLLFFSVFHFVRCSVYFATVAAATIAAEQNWKKKKKVQAHCASFLGAYLCVLLLKSASEQILFISSVCWVQKPQQQRKYQRIRQISERQSLSIYIRGCVCRCRYCSVCVCFVYVNCDCRVVVVASWLQVNCRCSKRQIFFNWYLIAEQKKKQKSVALEGNKKHKKRHTAAAVMSDTSKTKSHHGRRQLVSDLILFLHSTNNLRTIFIHFLCFCLYLIILCVEYLVSIPSAECRVESVLLTIDWIVFGYREVPPPPAMRFDFGVISFVRRDRINQAMKPRFEHVSGANDTLLLAGWWLPLRCRVRAHINRTVHICFFHLIVAGQFWWKGNSTVESMDIHGTRHGMATFCFFVFIVLGSQRRTQLARPQRWCDRLQRRFYA